MTELEKAARQALKALEQYHSYMEPLTTVFGGPRVPAEQSTTGKVEEAITALRQALEQQPAEEPVITVRVWRDESHDQNAEFRNWHALPDGEHTLYTRPQPAAQWVGLTDEEIWSDGSRIGLSDRGIREFARAIEAKLREKNT